MNRWILINTNGSNDVNCSGLGENSYHQMRCGSATAYYDRDGRFMDDELFCCSDKQILIHDGVTLNLSELKVAYKVKNINDLISKFLIKDGKEYFSSFIGPFCGALYENETDELIAYGNQTGDTFVFYCCNDKFNAVSDDFNLLVTLMKDNGVRYELDEDAALHLMSFGFMVDDRTQIKQIKRALPGECVRIRGGKIERKVWHRFSFLEDTHLSEQEAMDLLDKSFRKAVARCFEKDIEYEYPEHLVELSGGLDSRMTAWVGHDLGYTPAVYINYSQFGSDEQRYASRVALELQGQFFHKQLDDALFLQEIDRLVDMNYGLSIYFGLTGGESFARSINYRRFGLEHSGQIGDAVVGTFGRTEDDVSLVQERIKYSRVITSEIPKSVALEHSGYEELCHYTRAFLGALSSHAIKRNYTYLVSPFLDPDFFSLCMSIPVKLRQGHTLYWKWIEKFYPRAAKLPSTRIRSRFTKEYLRNKTYRVAMQIGLLTVHRGDMNPIQYWYNVNESLRKFIKSYYDENRDRLVDYPITGERVDKMYLSSAVTDKLLAINMLAVMKRYFR